MATKTTQTKTASSKTTTRKPAARKPRAAAATATEPKGPSKAAIEAASEQLQRELESPQMAQALANAEALAERVTFKDAAERVLRAADGPLKVKAIAEQAIPLVSPAPTGKTPAATLGAHLIVDANKGGRFVKTAPGTFDVREINPRGAAKRPNKA